MWTASDAQGTAPPAFTPSPFNTITFALTRLDAQVTTTANFLIGISDVRGDGRPDYHYQAQSSMPTLFHLRASAWAAVQSPCLALA